MFIVFFVCLSAPISSKAASTLQPFSASVPSASTLTTQSLSSGPGGSTPSSASPQGTEQSQKQQAAPDGTFFCYKIFIELLNESVTVIIPRCIAS